jgi:carboxypeptidase Taq
MSEKLTKLKEILAEVQHLTEATSLLGWDQQTYMPEGATESRGEQLGTLSRLAHEKFVSTEVGTLLDALKSEAAGWDPDSDDARLIAVAAKRYAKESRVPAKWVSEFAEVTTVAHPAWAEARAENKFEKFLPFLMRVLDLRRQYAGFFAPYDHIYDPLLDDFESGLKTADVQPIFAELRAQQTKLVHAVAAKPEVDDSFLHQPFDEQKQWDFGVEVITKFGYDWNRGRQDRSAHPFTTSFSMDDVRITTRFDPKWLSPALFGTMHECGHALYEQGLSPTLKGTFLADGASMAIHESQSRMWENLVGRSKEFWTFFYPRLQTYFPDQLKNVDLDTFYKGINKVNPSLIRVEADEATYNMHIMLRLELEIAMMEGSLNPRDLPEAWNSRMQEYLGVTPPTDTLGVLQDIHWSGGSVGYFPTYSLGNLVSVQLWEKINKDLPDLKQQISQGEFSGLLGWLRQNLHRHGAKYEPQDLMQRVVGSKIDPAPYLRYLQTKFGEIYSI